MWVNAAESEFHNVRKLVKWAKDNSKALKAIIRARVGELEPDGET